jgi:hypothetical protein
MTTDAMMIDCDGHILEPPDLWEKYLEPRYRDRAIRIRVGDDAFEYLEIDGKRAVLPRPGQLGNLGGMGKRVDEAKHLRERAMRGEIRPEEMRGIRPDPERTYLRGPGSAPWTRRSASSSSIARAWPRPSSIRRSGSCGKPN